MPASAAAIGGFGAGDKIDLGNFIFDPGSTQSFTGAASHTGGTLSAVKGGSQTRQTLSAATPLATSR